MCTERPGKTHKLIPPLIYKYTFKPTNTPMLSLCLFFSLSLSLSRSLLPEVLIVRPRWRASRLA